MKILMILVVMMTTPKSYAYKLTEDFIQGYFWGEFPIRMRIVAANHAEGAQLEELVSSVLDEWENAIGVDVWEVEPGYQIGGDISGNVIRWSLDIGGETGFDPFSTLAVAIRTTTNTPLYRQTQILLNGDMGTLRQNFADSLFKTLLHEFGHTISLDHSNESQAIMAPSIGSIKYLQEDDIAGGNAAIDENLRRQSEGSFISGLSAGGDESNAFACASVELNPPGPPGGGFLSLLFGLFVSIFILRRDFKSILN